MKHNIYLFLAYSLFAKISAFLFSSVFAILQANSSSSVAIAAFTIYIQWNAVASIFDFGFINWISITKRPIVAKRMFDTNVLSASTFVALIFNIYFISATYRMLQSYDYILSFVDIFISYFLLCQSFLLAKKSLFKAASILQLCTIAGPTIFLLLCLTFGFEFSFAAIICFGIAGKILFLLLYYLKPSTDCALVYNPYKFVKSIRFSSRYLLLQMCTFLQFGCDYFIGFYLFELNDFNNYAAQLRVLQSSLFVSGVVSSLLINYSTYRFQGRASSYALIFSIALQALFCYIYSNVIGVNIDFLALCYISFLAAVSIIQTQHTIVDSFAVLRLYALTTLPILILKVTLVYLLRIDGLAIVAFIQLLLLMLVNKSSILFISQSLNSVRNLFKSMCEIYR